MKWTIVVLCFLLAAGCARQGPEVFDYPISAVNLTHVTLSDNFWLPKIKTIQGTTIQYAFDKCEKEGRMENFLIAGGVKSGPVKGQMPFDDTDVYKIIEGASLSLVMMPNPQLSQYLDTVIQIIKTGQEPDGYLTTWKTIDPSHSPASWAKPGDRWENLDTSHELYNSGHLFEAAAAHYYATGKRNFLDIALKNADLLVKVFGPGKNMQVPGHQIVETGLVKLYRITGKKKYLQLAKHFLDQRGNASARKLYGVYNQDHLPVTRQKEVAGHAVRAVYMYAGMTDIAALYRDEGYLHAVHQLWENMVYTKMYITGGIGSRRGGEAFGESYELPNLTAYNETCAAIGSVGWNHRLFLLTGDAKYYDVIERTLYNGLISGISHDGTRFFYPNPLEVNGKYTFNQGSCSRQPWFNCSCCPTNIIRFVPSIPNLIYATEGDTLYINLFMSNRADLTVGRRQVKVVQTTDYPWDGKVIFSIEPQEPGEFSIKLRIPGWARNRVLPGELYHYRDETKGSAAVSVNGEAVAQHYEKGYLMIRRTWRQGDRITMSLPYQVRLVVSHPQVKNNAGRVALETGPIVYCSEGIDYKSGEAINLLLDVNEPLRLVFRKNWLDGVMTVKGRAYLLAETRGGRISRRPVPFTAIPYYAWNNRGTTQMLTWIPIDGKHASPTPYPTLAATARVTSSGRKRLQYALNDMVWPGNSTSYDAAQFNWWPQKEKEGWIEYHFDRPVAIKGARVYWFTDVQRGGGCDLPKSWQILYQRGDRWVAAKDPSGYPVVRDRVCQVRFKPFSATKIRLQVEMGHYSAGLYEWDLIEAN